MFKGTVKKLIGRALSLPRRSIFTSSLYFRVSRKGKGRGFSSWGTMVQVNPIFLVSWISS